MYVSMEVDPKNEFRRIYEGSGKIEGRPAPGGLTRGFGFNREALVSINDCWFEPSPLKAFKHPLSRGLSDRGSRGMGPFFNHPLSRGLNG